MNIKGQGHSLSQRSLRFLKLIFLKKNARPIEAKFQIEFPWDIGMKIC